MRNHKFSPSSLVYVRAGLPLGVSVLLTVGPVAQDLAQSRLVHWLVLVWNYFNQFFSPTESHFCQLAMTPPQVQASLPCGVEASERVYQSFPPQHLGHSRVCWVSAVISSMANKTVCPHNFLFPKWNASSNCAGFDWLCNHATGDDALFPQ